MKATLLLIAAFFMLVVLSFVWFVATWDPSREDPVSHRLLPLMTEHA